MNKWRGIPRHVVLSKGGFISALFFYHGWQARTYLFGSTRRRRDGDHLSPSRMVLPTASPRSRRQLASLALVHPGQYLAGQQVRSEHTQRGDSFEDHSGQMGDCDDRSVGRGDWTILVTNGLVSQMAMYMRSRAGAYMIMNTASPVSTMALPSLQSWDLWGMLRKFFRKAKPKKAAMRAAQTSR
jgi:hypothetical protein